MTAITKTSYPGECFESDATDWTDEELGSYINLRIMSGASPIVVVKVKGRVIVFDWV